MRAQRETSERALVLLVAAVQFVNILDFMMVMPLGPDFARALGIPTSQLGLIGGSYTGAAAVAGLVGSLFLDRFDRRLALGVAMLGLVLGTAAGGFATGLGTLMAARLIAGTFGGPATSLSFSIIADAVPPERRGKAMGTVMGAFSAAAVFGVPAGLWLAGHGGWRVPFFAVAGLGVVLALGAVMLLPPMRGHLETRKLEGAPRYAELLRQPVVLLSYLMTAIVMTAGFLLIPNISAFLQVNLGYPRDRLGFLYLVGGTGSFFMTQLGGRLVDRFGSFRVGAAASALIFAVLQIFFRMPVPPLPVLALFVSFMLSMALRNVSYNTLTSRVPSARDRARFLSLQSAVQHAASASGAFLSARILRELPGGVLVGMDRIAIASMALTAAVPFFLFAVEARVRRRERDAAPAPPYDPVSGVGSASSGLAGHSEVRVH